MKILAKSLSATTLALTISLLLASCGKQDPAPAVEEKAASAEGGEHEEEAAESTVIDKAEADANGIKTASATAGTIAQELDRLKRLRTCSHTWSDQPLLVKGTCGRGMNSSSSPGTLGKRPAVQSSRACLIRSREEETKFHQTCRWV